MKRKRTNPVRYFFLCALAVAVCLIFIARLINLQLVSADYYNYVDENTYTRTEKIKAQRGEIFDRNGTPLVSNVYYNNILLDYGDIPADAVGFNGAILTVLRAAELCGETEKLTEPNYPLAGSPIYPRFSADYVQGGKMRPKLVKLLCELGYGGVDKTEEERKQLAEDITAEELREYLLRRYRLTDENGNSLYSAEETEELLRRRYDLDYIRFSPNNQYVFAERVSMEFITYCAESGQRGITTEKHWERVYNYPGYASHILGNMGSITDSTYDHYMSLGYSLNETVGVSGAEKAFEPYLRGIDGELTVVEDEFGNIIDQYVSKEPVAGKDVWLTIDINIQMAAEDALAATIKDIAKSAEEKPGELDGEDADAGACTAICPTSGEIYALASYPTYDLSTYREKISELLSDETTPLVNRALNGLYPPGSTFKPATAAASLAEGIITPETIITDYGRYTYYPDYQPRCWIYLNYGWWHGDLNVVGAIQNSCNIFFFECGRLLTIEKLNHYCRGFGLGEATGIELPEATGILAGPDYVESAGLGSWGPGDTLQAAIGQSYNTFTPLQLSVYVSALTNGGTRYKAHLLHSVHDYASGETLYASSPEKVTTLSLAESVVDQIKFAMQNVNENGSTSAIFKDYPITMGGKTGTAQISKTSSDNGVFVAFAPLEKPEIVVSAVVEHGASGTPLGAVAKGIFDSYFGLDKTEENE